MGTNKVTVGNHVTTVNWNIKKIFCTKMLSCGCPSGQLFFGQLAFYSNKKSITQDSIKCGHFSSRTTATYKLLGFTVPVQRIFSCRHRQERRVDSAVWTQRELYLSTSSFVSKSAVAVQKYHQEEKRVKLKVPSAEKLQIDRKESKINREKIM